MKFCLFVLDCRPHLVIFSDRIWHDEKLKKLKLKPDKLFLVKPSQNYGVSPDQVSHNFTCSLT